MLLSRRVSTTRRGNSGSPCSPKMAWHERSLSTIMRQISLLNALSDWLGSVVLKERMMVCARSRSISSCRSKRSR